MFLSGWALGGLLLVPAAPAPFADARLEWKFEKGKPFYQKIVTETDQQMKVGGATTTQKQKQTFVLKWAPVRRQPDRSLVIKQTIEALTLDVDVGGSKISYDSAKPGEGQLAAVFKGFVGAELTLTISPQMRVTKVVGREELVRKLGDGNPAMKPLLEQLLSEGACKEMIGPLLTAVPNRAVRRGERWRRQSLLPLGPMGDFDTQLDCTYEGPAQGLQKVVVKSKLTHRPPKRKAAVGLPFKIKSSDLKSAGAAGFVLFNPAKGRVERAEMKTSLTGKFTIEIGGSESEIELSQAQTTTLTITGSRPGPDKK